MIGYKGSPRTSIEAQADLMKSHVTRAVPQSAKSEGGRTLQLAVPAGWTTQGLCVVQPSIVPDAAEQRRIMSFHDDAVGLKEGEAAARCAGCPVIAECLSEAMEFEGGLAAGSRYAIRGGLSPKERADIAFTTRACERGHTERWGGGGKKSKSPICLECKAENRREAYRLQREDPEFLAQRAARIREAHSTRTVTCLDCKNEMRVASFARHLATTHGESEAA